MSMEKLHSRINRLSIFSQDDLKELTNFPIKLKDSAEITSCIIQVLGFIRKIIVDDLIDGKALKKIIRSIKSDIDIIDSYKFFYPDLSFNLFEFFLEFMKLMIEYSVDFEAYESASNLTRFNQMFQDEFLIKMTN